MIPKTDRKRTAEARKRTQDRKTARAFKYGGKR